MLDNPLKNENSPKEPHIMDAISDLMTRVNGLLERLDLAEEMIDYLANECINLAKEIERKEFKEEKEMTVANWRAMAEVEVKLKREAGKIFEGPKPRNSRP